MTGVIISIGMVILLLFINQSSMAGHSSSDSIMSFPKNDIREIRTETIQEATYLGVNENNNQYLGNISPRGQLRSDAFNTSFLYYASNLTNLTAVNGCLVNVSAMPSIDSDYIKNATISIYYNNGETMYNETMILNIA